jgi:hypothetical protein
MDTAFFDQQLSAIHRAFPDFQNPLEPATLPRLDGQFKLDAAAFWADISAQVEAGTYRLRSPARTTEGLSGPFRGKGGCLEPLACDGDEIWIDPKMQAQAGDFVLIELQVDVLAGIYERGARKDGFLDMYGEKPSPIAGKVLTNCGHEYVLATNESLIELEPNRVLGVVRRIERNGVALYAADPAECSMIAPNAATEITSVSVPSTTLSVIAGALATISVGAKAEAYTATVTASANVWQGTSGGAFVFLAQLFGGVPGGTVSQPVPVLSGASPGQNVSAVFSFAVAASTAMTFALWYNSGTAGNFGRGTNIDLRVDVVKK